MAKAHASLIVVGQVSHLDGKASTEFKRTQSDVQLEGM